MSLARDSLIQAQASLPKASYLQAVTGYAILRDKERLDAGEPTEYIAIRTKIEVEGLDRLCEALTRSLLPEKSAT